MALLENLVFTEVLSFQLLNLALMQACFHSLRPLLKFLIHIIFFYKENCVAFKLTSQKPRQTFTTLQAYWHVLLKAWPKQFPCQRVVSPKGAHVTT